MIAMIDDLEMKSKKLICAPINIATADFTTPFDSFDFPPSRFRISDFGFRIRSEGEDSP